MMIPQIDPGEARGQIPVAKRAMMTIVTICVTPCIATAVK